MRKAVDLDKIRPNNKNVTDVKEERNSGKARLIRWKISDPEVIMEWGFNEACTENQLFRLRIGKESALISVEDIKRFMRWV